MKRFLLTLVLLLTTLNLNSSAEASGSNTVFLSVRPQDYAFATAIADEYFNNSKLYDYLENSQSNKIVVARVNPYIYRTAYYYTAWGYEMDLGFQQYETVTFKYYPRLGAVMGVNSDDELVVLLPKVPPIPPFGIGILHD